MARTAVTLSDKIAKAVEGELTNSEQAYFDWIVEQAEAQGVVVKLDATTFKLARGMYNDYIADPDVAAANEQRRKENEAKKNERKNKAIERARALLPLRVLRSLSLRTMSPRTTRTTSEILPTGS